MARQSYMPLFFLAVLVIQHATTSGQEPPKPAPEFEILKGLEGTWDAVVKFGEQESKGVAVYKPECNGMWMVSDFNGEFGGTKFQGRGFDGYDTDKKKYIGIWVDSMTTSPMISEGTYDSGTKTLTYVGESKGPDGKPAKIRSTTSFKDSDRHSFKMFAVGADKKEQLMMTIEYTRRK